MIVPLTLQTTLTGTGASAVSLSNSFSLGTKKEEILTLDVDTVPKELDFSNIANLKFIMLQSTGSFIVTLNKHSVDVIFDVVGGLPFILPMSDDNLADLDSILLSTTSEDVIYVNIMAYGEQTA